MNHKIFFLALVLTSLHFALPNQAVSSGSNQEKAISNNTESSGLPALESHHEILLLLSWNKDIIFIDLTHSADDSRFYLFHLERVRRGRWSVRFWLTLARLVIIISHLSVLLYAFKGLIAN